MKNHFTIVYNKETRKIESFVVPENEEEDLFDSVNLFNYQEKIEVPMKDFTGNIYTLQEYLNNLLK
jgi:hypothetical protein